MTRRLRGVPTVRDRRVSPGPAEWIAPTGYVADPTLPALEEEGDISLAPERSLTAYVRGAITEPIAAHPAAKL